LRTSRRTLRRRAGRSGWHWLLLVPIVLPLWTPLFNRLDPRLLGIPFFYWGQLAMVFLAMLVIGVVHLLTRNVGG
jgi:hypothetical protein